MELKVLRQLVAERSARLDDALHRINSLEAGNACLEKQLQAAVSREVSALKRANHDELTGLPNRGLLMDRLTQILHQVERRGSGRVAVLFLDLNGFKGVNDQYGHLVGDALLKQVARRLRGCLRATDTACRYGGDEFVVVLPDARNPEAVQVVINRIRKQLAKPFQVEEYRIPVAASTGWASFPEHGRDALTLIRRADAVMYRGKQEPRQCFPGND